MSKIKDKAIEKLNRQVLDDKLSEIEREEQLNKYANKFTTLEPDYYQREERDYKLSVLHQFDGFQVFNI